MVRYPADRGIGIREGGRDLNWTEEGGMETPPPPPAPAASALANPAAE